MRSARGQSTEPGRDPDAEALTGLLAETAAGDRTAFADLYKQTSARLMGVALSMAADRQLAEDALQDAYLSIWQKAGHFNADAGSPMSWLTAIVRYRTIDRLRACKGRRREVLLPEKDLAWLAGEDRPPSPNVDGNGGRDIRRCLKQLNENHRRAILLAFYLGLSHGELATRLNSPLGTVKSWIRRGLSNLKTCLDGV